MPMTFEEIDQIISGVDVFELDKCLHCGEPLTKIAGMDSCGDPAWEIYCNNCGYIYAED